MSIGHPSWSPVPAAAPAPAPGDAGLDEHDRHGAGTDHYTVPGPGVPTWLASRIGVMTAAVLCIGNAVGVLVFGRLAVPAVFDMLAVLPAGSGVVAALMVGLPLVLGVVAVWPLRAAGYTAWPRLRPRRPGDDADPDSPSDRDDAAISEALRRVLPISRAMTYLGWLQIATFLAVVCATCIVLLLTGDLGSLPVRSGLGVTTWLCLEIALVLALTRGWVQVVLLIASGVATVTFQAIALDVTSVERLSLMAAALILGMLIYGVDRFLIHTARLSGTMLLDQRVRLGTAARLDAEVFEAGRIEDLIHDNILSCLLLTSRGGAEDEWASQAIKQHAASALETLDEIANPTPTPALTPLATDSFTRKLIEQIRTHDPHIGVTIRGRRRRPVPAEIGHTLLAATLEAVRNSLRHAEGQLLRGDVRIRRQVSVVLGEHTVAIEIDDNGVGFDPATLPPRTIGLRDSILRRVQQLPGGHAGVASAPMSGTVVQLSWTDEQAGDAQTAAALDTEEFQLRKPTMSKLVVIALGMMAAVAVATLDAFTPSWVSLVALALFVAFGFILSVDWPTATGAPPAWSWPYLGLFPSVITALTLLAYDPTVARIDFVWTGTAVICMIVVLSMAQYYAAAWIGAVSSAILMIVWSVATDHPGAPFVGVWPIYLGTALFCTVMGSWAKNRIDASAQLQSEREVSVARHVEQAEVLRQRRSRSAELDIVVRPLVTRLASDEPVTPEMELEAGLLESRLRDDMRARCFHGTDVSRAAWDARARGVIVELMDDGGLASASSALRDAVVAVAASRIDAATSGQITARVLPADRDIVATILYRPASGAQTRTEVHEDGRARTATA